MTLKRFLLFLLNFFYIAPIFCQESIDTTLFISDFLVYFDSDSYTTDKPAIAKIDSLSRIYIDNKEVLIFIEAHTDKVGSDDYNIELSKRREESVKASFLLNGIPDSVIISKHFGESQVISSETSEVGNRLNRRVRISIAKRKQLIRVKGKVLDKESKLPLVAEINLSTKEFKSATQSNSRGDFSLLSPLGERVNLEVLAPNYFIESNSLLITEKHRDIILKVPLPKLELGRKYLFKNMLFKGNLSIMVDASERSAHNLQRFMNLHPDVCIEIRGHINQPLKDSVDRSTADFELSVARAIEIKNQLMEEGVNPQRMLARGYGNWEMKFPKARTEKEMALNRRVEIGIITCEEAESQEDDKLEVQDRYRKTNFRRFYSQRLVESEIENSNYRLRILLQASSMIEKGMEPSLYTYKEIFDAYPDLPSKKQEK